MPSTHPRDSRPNSRARSLPPRFRINWVAAGLRRAALEAGVIMPVGYSCQLALDGLALDSQLGVTRLGDGVVIHTSPEGPGQLPVVLGFADADHQWYRDGRRHIEPETTRR